MVVDCGGGTVDITVYEVENSSGHLRELHKASGGPYGSVGVDRQFEALLERIFGSEFIETYKTEVPEGYVFLMLKFESRKLCATTTVTKPLNIELPYTFIQSYLKYVNNMVSFGTKFIQLTQLVSILKTCQRSSCVLQESGPISLKRPTFYKTCHRNDISIIEVSPITWTHYSWAVRAIDQPPNQLVLIGQRSMLWCYLETNPIQSSNYISRLVTMDVVMISETKAIYTLQCLPTTANQISIPD